MSASFSVLDDRYVLTRQIGVGGFSQVWCGHDQVLDRPVAIKLLHVFTGHEDALRRFENEARHAGLVSHQNVARVYDYGAPGPAHPPYLVMELVQGESLARALEREGALNPRRTLAIIEQAAAGLQAVHEAGLIHRDIKPANLLLSESGEVKVTDFGISQAAESVPLTLTGMIVGSPAYLAPERAEGARATVASDLYALGIVAYECLSGSRPYFGSMIEVALAHRDRPLPPLPPFVPPELAGFVRELTAKDPGHRPASAAEIASLAAELRHGSASSALTMLSGAGVGDGIGLGAEDQAGAGGVVGAGGVAGAERGGRTLAFRVGICAAATVLVGALTLILFVAANRLAGSEPSSAHGQSLQSGKTSQVAAARVEVDRRALLGEPIAIARAQLERRHLKVLVRWRRTTAQRPGRVVAVNPAGKVSADALVTITGAQAPSDGPPHRLDRHKPPGPGHGPPGRGGPGPPGHGHGPGPPGRGHHRGGPDGPPGQNG